MTEKIKVNKKSFNRIKEMLMSTDEEDVNLAMETLFNMDINNVLLTLLAKSLSHDSRHILMTDKRFKDKWLIDVNNLEWKKLFPIIRLHLRHNSRTGLLEKEIVNEMITKLIKSHLLYDNFHDIINDIDIKINWKK